MKIRKGLIGAGALMAGLLSGPAWAEQSIKARDLIQQIFGVDAETLASAFATAGQGNSILGNVASVVNTVALLGAAIIVLLTLTNGLLQTGEHGKIMGRYSAVWVPLRTMIALGMLTPLNLVGYSVVQAAVLWGSLQGAGFADQGWSYANEYMSTNMRLSAPVSSKSTQSTVSGLYQMEVCAAAVARAGEAANGTFGVDRDVGMTQAVVESGGWLWFEPDMTSVVTLNYKGTGDYESADGLCGKMTIAHDQGSLGGGESGLYWQGQEMVQRRNIDALRMRLRTIAEQVVTGGVGAEQSKEALRAAEIEFADAEQRRLSLFNTRLDSLTADIRQNQLAKSSEAGWIGAGAWYMTFAGMNSEIAQSLGDDPVFEPARLEEMTESLQADVKPLAVMAGRTRPNTTDAPINLDTLPEWESGSEAPILDWVWDYVAAEGMHTTRLVFDQILASTVGDDGSTDPVVAMSGIGQKLVTGAWVLLSGFGVVALLLIAKGGMAGAVLVSMVAGVLFPFVLIAVVVGVFLQYILPAMPYFIWVAGVAGWLLMVVQAVVAAPLWAASHAMPEGEGFSGQRAMQGWMLLIALLARPLLMVVGLVASMLVVKAIAAIIFVTFGWFTSSALLGTVGNPLHLFIWIVLFAALFIVMVRWSFSLIHLVPDAVLRFIGSAGESFGESNIAEQVRSMALAVYGVGKQTMGPLGNIGKVPWKPGGGAKNADVTGR